MSPTEQSESTSHEAPSAPANPESANADPRPASPPGAPSGEAAASPSDAQASTQVAARPERTGDASGETATGEAASGETASAGGAGTTPEGGEKKRRRRRRRKKKSGEGAGADAAGADGAHAEDGDSEEGGEAGEGDAQADGGASPDGAKAEGEGGRKGDRKKPGKKKRRGGEAPTRERPAFNVSDVVFGKIVEINDDIIIVDLSGKAMAIFDKLELVLPEDSIDVEDDARRAEELAESILAGTIDPDVALHAHGAAAAAAAVPEEPEAQAQEKEAAGPESQSPRGKIIRIVRPSAEAESDAPAAPAAPVEVVASEASTDGAATDAAPQPADASPEAGGSAVASDAVATPAAQAAAPQSSPTPAEPKAEPSAAAPAASEEEKSSVLQLPRVVLEPGAPFVGVVRNDGSRGGLVVLTHHPHRASKTKPLVAAAFKKRAPIPGLVTGVIKGGVEVDIEGVRAFAPGSQMELRLGADLHPLVGKRLPFLVTQYAKRGRDVIVSRRPMLEAEAKVAREAALATLKVGQVIEGIVRSVVQFGAFVDLGGIDGLVPLTEMSHNRGDRPSDVFKVGEKATVLVQRIDDKGKVSLSHKATLPDPWGEAAKKYALGTRHTGKVVRIREFGAFVELESGIDGLIHGADLSFKRIEKVEDAVNVGDTIEVVVSSLDSGQQKIGLHPALTGERAEEAPQKVEVGRTVKAQVVAIETGGLLMRVLGATGRSARAFMPASATDTPRGTELRKLFPPGHVMECKIIEKDPRRGEVKLSIRALKQETERNAYQQYRQQVKREAKFGTFADLLAKKTPQK